MSGSRTIDVTSRGFLKPAPSLPSTTSPSTPASTARCAPFSVGTTWNTIRPASLRIGPYLSGDPADVVTNSTPSSTIICTMSGSRRNASGRFTPNGFDVSSRVRRMSSRVTAVPSDPGISPIAPASDTAATNGGLAT